MGVYSEIQDDPSLLPGLGEQQLMNDNTEEIDLDEESSIQLIPSLGFAYQIKKKLFAILVVLVVLVFFTTVFIVDETEQVVVLAFGKPVKTITKPGLNFKLPAPVSYTHLTLPTNREV